MRARSARSARPAAVMLLAAAMALGACAAPRVGSETVTRRDVMTAVQSAGMEFYLVYLPGHFEPAVLIRKRDGMAFLGSYMAVFEKVTAENDTLQARLHSPMMAYERLTDDRTGTIGYVVRDERIDVDPEYDDAGNGFRLRLEKRERDAHDNE